MRTNPQKSFLSLLFFINLFTVGCSTDVPHDASSSLEAQRPVGEGNIVMISPTRFKSSKRDMSSAQASPDLFCLIDQKTSLAVRAFDGDDSEDGHVKVQLIQKPAGCNFSTGYFFREHVEIRRHNDFQTESGASNGEGGINRKLIAYYGQNSNYNRVYDNVVGGWFGTTKDACVAFASSALRLSKTLNVPFGGTSLNTRSFSNYLKNLSWKKTTNFANLQPGDVIFTRDHPDYPGYPAHVMIFASWANRAQNIANIIDNQGFKYERSMSGGGRTPYAYSYRSLK